MIFKFYSIFSMKILLAHRIAPDGTLRSAASHLGLCCLPLCPTKRMNGLKELSYHCYTRNISYNLEYRFCRL